MSWIRFTINQIFRPYKPTKISKRYVQASKEAVWCVEWAQGCQSLLPSLSKVSGALWELLRALGTTLLCGALCEMSRFSVERKFLLWPCRKNHRVVGSLLDCGKRQRHRAAVSGWNRGEKRSSGRSFRHGQSRNFRSIILIFLVCHLLWKESEGYGLRLSARALRHEVGRPSTLDL